MVVIGSGLAVVVARGVLTALGQSGASAARADVAAKREESARTGLCGTLCEAAGKDELARKSNAEVLRALGIGTTLSAGVVAIGIGTALSLTGNDVHRLDDVRSARRRLMPAATASGISWQF